MCIAPYVYTQLHSHANLIAGKIEHIIRESHPHIVAPHVYGQVKFVVPDEELKTNCTRGVLWMNSWVFNVNDRLTAERVFLEHISYKFLLVKSIEFVNLMPIVAVDGDSIF